ncbi:MAG: TIGR04282 family arsenosugar biosynthesis glycosyltransferase [Halieaceae bacterium]|jgi:rSAM/selenodomain-associated transferase 1|nr:TIGR04282 family arsenosugar biosynthesis glycosyltransferase [Halieaceae bacterium]
MNDLVIAQLAREPVPGEVKTRMQPGLSTQRALDLHTAMVRYMVERLSPSASLELWVDGAEDHPLFIECLALGARRIVRQPPGDLGERMAHIASELLLLSRKVVLVGSDAPTLGAAQVSDMSRALDSADLCFVPALDGGYVMLGLRTFVPEVFTGIEWGTGRVLSQSLDAAAAAGRQVELLEPVPDIDVAEDLRWLPPDLAW